MKYFIGVSLTASCLLTLVNAFYDAGSNVVELTPNNFHQKVVSSDAVWVVEFYAPWCGHCKNLVPEYKKAAKALKGVVMVGAVNADEHRGLGGQYDVKGFPTIKIFAADKYKPDDYQGERSAQGIVDGAMKAAKKMVDQQLSGKKTGGGGGGKKQGDPKDVIELTDANFKEKVLKSNDMWLVEFYAPWCGHCKNLAPHWAQAASELKGKVKLGALDATVHTITAGQYGIQGFPTIKYFPAGEKDAPEDYDGGRTAGDIVNWAMERAVENIPPPEVVQLTSNSVLKSSCEEHPICIMSFLPHILDCQSECRNEYIRILTKMGDKFKKQMWGWVWSEAGAHLDLEESLGIGGFGYPALTALSTKKMKYSLLRGSFSDEGISEFLRDLSYGRGSTAPVKGASLPKISSIDAWDGKDGEFPIEDDIDLSDVELDDLDKDEL